jgi:GH25 family lysozyme M1 (1,4-beta-N-acetylmuramidase)/fibronectin type 3 domain-containing protein
MRMKKNTALLAVLAAAALCFNVPASLSADTLTNTSEVEGEVVLTTGSPFTDLTYTHENKFEDYELFNGIDVSKWQGEIDWAACKEAGVDFVFVRVGYRGIANGEIKEDPYYRQNIEGALANDISVGVYFFSEALTKKEVKQETDFLLNCIKDYDITFPVVFDYEGGYYTVNGKSYPGRVEQAYQNGTLDKNGVTKLARAFCKYVSDAGYTPMIYSSANGLLNEINGVELGEEYLIWQARYATSTDPRNGYLYYSGNYEYWQYSDSGYIGSMKVDCNFLYKNFNIKTSQPSASDQTADSITLEWEPTSDAHGYRVYRLDPDTGKYTRIGTTKDCTYTDEGLSPGTEYTYKIRAYWKIGGTTYTAKYSPAVSASATVRQVQNLTVSARAEDSITLSWDAVKKASGYNIYRYDADSGEYLEIASVSGKSNTACQITGLTESKAYKFAVRAYRNYNGEKLTGEASEALSTRTNPVKVKSLTASATTASSISLEFTTQKRVTGYYVYRYDASAEKWKKIGTSTDGTFTDDTVAVSTAYKYRVRAYKESGDVTYYGKYSSVLTVRSNPDKVKNLTASKTTSKSITLKFTTQKRVTGYLVYRYNESTGKWKWLGISTDGTFKDSTVQANTGYKYRVRAYKISGDVTYYGKYSKALTAKSAKAKK